MSKGTKKKKKKKKIFHDTVVSDQLVSFQIIHCHALKFWYLIICLFFILKKIKLTLFSLFWYFSLFFLQIWLGFYYYDTFSSRIYFIVYSSFFWIIFLTFICFITISLYKSNCKTWYGGEENLKYGFFTISFNYFLLKRRI